MFGEHGITMRSLAGTVKKEFQGQNNVTVDYCHSS